MSEVAVVTDESPASNPEKAGILFYLCCATSILLVDHRALFRHLPDECPVRSF